MPDKLRNSLKGLINIKSNDNKCFLCRHIRHLNPLKIHPERITKADKNRVDNIHYVDIKFLHIKFLSFLDYSKIEQKNNICMMHFVMKII